MFASRPNAPAAPLGTPPAEPARGHGGAAETVDSLRLLHGHRELLIRHGDEVYRLRHTRNDKLILTK